MEPEFFIQTNGRGIGGPDLEEGGINSLRQPLHALAEKIPGNTSAPPVFVYSEFEHMQIAEYQAKTTVGNKFLRPVFQYEAVALLAGELACKGCKTPGIFETAFFQCSHKGHVLGGHGCNIHFSPIPAYFP